MNPNDAAVQGFSIGLYLIIALVFYLVLAYPLYVMGQKTGSNNAWFAFIPILNIVLMLEIAGKDLWWIILFLVPCVNIVITVIVWMGIAERMEKPGWLGILMIVPILNLIMPWYFAFG